MKLYSSMRSPFVLKVMVAAHVAGVADAIDRVPSTSVMDAPSDALMADNPLSKMPTLVTDDGEALFDSVVICEYLAGLKPEAGLVPQGAARLTMMRWQSLADGLLDVLVLWRNERDRPEGRSMASWIASFRKRTLAALDHLEARIGGIGDGFDLGHIGVGCALCYLDLRFADLGWRQGRPALTAWQEAFMARPEVAAAAAGYLPPPGAPAAASPSWPLDEPRLDRPDREALSERGRAVYDDIEGSRGGVRGPFRALLHSPELADRFQKLGAFVRYETGFTDDVREVAILATAQRWACSEEWRLHEAHGREAGLSDVVIADLRSGRRSPQFTADQAAAFDFVTELHDRHWVSDAAYAAATQSFTPKGVVELAALAGYYAMIAMTLNGHQLNQPPS